MVLVVIRVVDRARAGGGVLRLAIHLRLKRSFSSLLMRGRKRQRRVCWVHCLRTHSTILGEALAAIIVSIVEVVLLIRNNRQRMMVIPHALLLVMMLGLVREICDNRTLIWDQARINTVGNS